MLFSQEQIALLLGITRSQWAMYTTGQRGLSLTGKIKLEQLITSSNQVSFFKKEKLVQEIEQEEEWQKQLQHLIKDNKLKQLKLQKKIKNSEEKYQTALHTLHLINNLEDKRSKVTIDKSILQVLRNKANKVVETNGLAMQEICKVKLEVLIHEEGLLKMRKQKL